MISKLKEVGFNNFIIGLFMYVRNCFFYTVYHYAKWHISPMYFRPYLLDTIRYLTDKYNGKKCCIVDIGCGNGELLRSIASSERSVLIGLDISSKILAYAIFLSKMTFKRNIKFYNGSLNSQFLRDAGSIDTLLMLNWTHSLDEAVFNNMLIDLLDTVDIKEIIIDYVPDYKNHNITTLTNGTYRIVKRLGSYLRGREILIMEKSACTY